MENLGRLLEERKLIDAIGMKTRFWIDNYSCLLGAFSGRLTLIKIETDGNTLTRRRIPAEEFPIKVFKSALSNRVINSCGVNNAE